jgi:hypothetical protein
VDVSERGQGRVHIFGGQHEAAAQMLLGVTRTASPTTRTTSSRTIFFGGRGKEKPLSFETGRSPQNQQVLGAPLDLMEMIKE